MKNLILTAIFSLLFAATTFGQIIDVDYKFTGDFTPIQGDSIFQVTWEIDQLARNATINLPMFSAIDNIVSLDANCEMWGISMPVPQYPEFHQYIASPRLTIFSGNATLQGSSQATASDIFIKAFVTKN
jgi:hypothetical protein